MAPNRAKDLDIANVKQIVAESNLEEVLNRQSEDQLQGKSNPLKVFGLFETIFEVSPARNPSSVFDPET